MALGLASVYNKVLLISISLFLFFVAQSLTRSAPSPSDQSSLKLYTRQDVAPKQQCGFTSNSDILGIGIRIGYYTQAIAMWFASFFYFREAKVLRTMNTLFIVAIFTAGSISAYNASSTYAAELFLLLQIGICVGVVGVLDMSRYSRVHWRISSERLAIKTALVCSGLAFNLWFWWVGLDKTPGTPCGTFIWYIVKADIYGWARMIMKVAAIYGFVSQTLFVASLDIALGVHAWIARGVRADFRLRLDDSTGDHARSTTTNQDNPQAPRQPTGDDLNCQRLLSNVQQCQSDPRGHLECRNHAPITEHINSAPQPLSSPPSCSRAVGKSGIPATKPSAFERIYAADEYLETILSIYPASTDVKRTRSCSVWHGRIKFYVPSFQTRCLNPAPSSTRCLFITSKAILYGKLPLSWVVIVLLHLIGRDKALSWRVPRYIYQMLSTMPAVQTDWQALTLASDIHLSQTPLIAPRWLWIRDAVTTLAIVLIFIGQVELTIIWNHMGGLSNLTTVGQLVPFILGVGGLIRVVWGKWCLVRKGIQEQPVVDEFEEKEKEAIQAYQKWKEAHKQRLELMQRTGA